jgi:hypothetical protein
LTAGINGRVDPRSGVEIAGGIRLQLGLDRHLILFFLCILSGGRAAPLHRR